MNISKVKISVVFLTLTVSYPVIAQAQVISTGGDDIVVTATRRADSVLDTPATVSVLTAASIEKSAITRPTEIVRSIPNIVISTPDRAGEAFVSVRGLAQARSADSIIAVIVDGVQLGSPEELNQELFDIQQIEVLKGPQGALYGRNAIGGAIVIKTRPPADQFQATASVGYGNGDAYNATGIVNIPLIKNAAALRVSVYQRTRSGFYYNPTIQENVDPLNERGVRARLDLNPSSALRIQINGNASKFVGGAVNFVPQFGTLDTNKVSTDFVFNVKSNDVQTKIGASSAIDFDTGLGHVVLTPAYSRVREHLVADGFPYTAMADTTQRAAFINEIKSAELKYVSPHGSSFNYIVGAYWAQIDRLSATTTGIDTGQGIVIDGQGPFGPGSVNPTTAMVVSQYRYDVLAGFAQANLSLGSRFDITAAIRYDHEVRRQTDKTPLQFSSFSGLTRQKTFNGLEPKFTVSYKPRENLNIYADYSQGFVSGGFNPPQTEALLRAADPTSTTPNEYGKQVNKALEVGMKIELLDKRLKFNAAAFHSLVSNLQQFQFFPAATLQTINPIDRSRVRGAEFEASLRLNAVTLSFAAGYSDSRITKYAANPIFVGNRAPYSPNYTINPGVEYVFELSNSIRGSAKIDYQRIGSEWFDIANTPGSRRSALDLANVNFSLGTNAWTVSLWAKNILDDRYNNEAIVLLPTLQIATPAQPRTYGVNLKVRFE